MRVPQFEEPRQVVEHSSRYGGEYEPALEVELLEGVRDGEEALDRHRQRDEHRSHAADVREAVTGLERVNAFEMQRSRNL